jgi:hypothetical protein
MSTTRPVCALWPRRAIRSITANASANSAPGKTEKPAQVVRGTCKTANVGGHDRAYDVGHAHQEYVRLAYGEDSPCLHRSWKVVILRYADEVRPSAGLITTGAGCSGWSGLGVRGLAPLAGMSSTASSMMGATVIPRWADEVGSPAWSGPGTRGKVSSMGRVYVPRRFYAALIC